MASALGCGNPALAVGEVSHLTRHHERHSQGEYE